MDNLSVMLDEKRRPQPLSATFYVKPRHTTRKTLSKIQLKLGSEGKVRKTVSSILKLVDLPTSYVDSIPDTEVDLSQAHPIFYYTGEGTYIYSFKLKLTIRPGHFSSRSVIFDTENVLAQL